MIDATPDLSTLLTWASQGLMPGDQVETIRQTTTCPVCKASGLDARGVSGHVRGARHRAMLQVRDFESSGLVSIDLRYMKVFEHIGNSEVLCRRGPRLWESLSTPMHRRNRWGHTRVHSQPAGRVIEGLWMHEALGRLVTSPSVSDHGLRQTFRRLAEMSEHDRTKFLNAAATAIRLGCPAWEAFT